MSSCASENVLNQITVRINEVRWRWEMGYWCIYCCWCTAPLHDDWCHTMLSLSLSVSLLMLPLMCRVFVYTCTHSMPDSVCVRERERTIDTCAQLGKHSNGSGCKSRNIRMFLLECHNISFYSLQQRSNACIFQTLYTHTHARAQRNIFTFFPTTEYYPKTCFVYKTYVYIHIICIWIRYMNLNTL